MPRRFLTALAIAPRRGASENGTGETAATSNTPSQCGTENQDDAVQAESFCVEGSVVSSEVATTEETGEDSGPRERDRMSCEKRGYVSDNTDSNGEMDQRGGLNRTGEDERMHSKSEEDPGKDSQEAEDDEDDDDVQTELDEDVLGVGVYSERSADDSDRAVGDPTVGAEHGAVTSSGGVGSTYAQKGAVRCHFCDLEIQKDKLRAHVQSCISTPISGPGGTSNHCIDLGDGEDCDPSGGAGSPNTGKPSGEMQDTGGGGGSTAEPNRNSSEHRCPICNDLFPPEEIDMHANACLEFQAQREDEMEKKMERAKR